MEPITDATRWLAESFIFIRENTMNPLTPADFELECLLARWEETVSGDYDRYLDESQDAMSEAEAVELADGATTRPFSE